MRQRRIGTPYLGDKKNQSSARELVGLPGRRQLVRSPAGLFIMREKKLQGFYVTPVVVPVPRKLDFFG
jgi:hypothetical protein